MGRTWHVRKQNAGSEKTPPLCALRLLLAVQKLRLPRAPAGCRDARACILRLHLAQRYASLGMWACGRRRPLLTLTLCLELEVVLFLLAARPGDC